jgi:hypothetical protein
VLIPDGASLVDCIDWSLVVGWAEVVGSSGVVVDAGGVVWLGGGAVVGWASCAAAADASSPAAATDIRNAFMPSSCSVKQASGCALGFNAHLVHCFRVDARSHPHRG